MIKSFLEIAEHPLPCSCCRREVLREEVCMMVRDERDGERVTAMFCCQCVSLHNDLMNNMGENKPLGHHIHIIQ